MTADVVPFPSPAGPRPPAPDLRVVGLLEELLVDARAGRIRTLAAATLIVTTDDPTPRPRLQWVDEPSLAMALSGAAAKMARDIAEW